MVTQSGGLLQQVPLSQFLQIEQATGVAYMFGPRPALQLHQSTDSFSVFWPLDPNRLERGRFLDTFRSVLASAGRAVQPISYLSAEVVLAASSPGQDVVTEGYPVVGDVGQSLEALQSLVSSYWTESKSIFLSASSPSITDGLALWTDTLQTPPGNATEIGLSARFGITTLVPLIDLLVSTVPPDFADVSGQLSALLTGPLSAAAAGLPLPGGA